MGGSSYLYNVGDVVNGLIITKQTTLIQGRYRKKAYKYICSTCGYDCGCYYKRGEFHQEHMIAENNLKSGAGCAVCANNGFVVQGINSIQDVAPWMSVYFVDKTLAYRYAPNSQYKPEVECPFCGRKKHIALGHLYHDGFSCICGDGFSYPEKFIDSFLQQLKVAFKFQYRFPNSLLRYDFYIPSHKVIIEVQGEQHYKQKFERDESINDKLKRDYALSRGILEDNYIELNCSESNVNFIKNSILNSRLNDIFNCETLDYLQIGAQAISNKVKECCQLWNQGLSIAQLADFMNVHKHTIISYLKKGNETGWCNYQPGDGIKRYPKEQRLKNLNGGKSL